MNKKTCVLFYNLGDSYRNGQINLKTIFLAPEYSNVLSNSKQYNRFYIFIFSEIDPTSVKMT